MKKMYSLFKILLSSWYGISAFKCKVSKNKIEFFKLIGILACIVVGFAPILIGYVLFMMASYDSFVTFGQAGVIITMGVVTSSVIVLFFGLFYVISAFYFTNDMEHLVTLPLKPWQILQAKFGVILTGEYITAFPLVLPPVIVYGIKSSAGILYWLYSLIGILIIPVIPLCIASVLAIVVMRLTNIGRRKDLFKIIGSIIGTFLILGIQFYIQRLAVGSGKMEDIYNKLFSENGLINMVSRNFPPAAWISNALINYRSISGFLYLLLFAGVTAVFVAAFSFFSEKLFLGGYIGSQEVSAKRKRIDENKLSDETIKRSKVSAIFWREFKILNRVPIFFLNCAFVVVLIPIIFLIVPVMSGNESFQEIRGLIQGENGSYIASLVIIGIGAFTSIANMTASTSISREGAQFFVSKFIPVSPREQIMGKFVHALVIDIAGNILTVASLWYIFRFDFTYLIASIVISCLASIPVIELSLIIDLFRPYLNWDNPQKAVKQNINGVVAMLVNALWVGVCLYLAGKFISNPLAGYAVLTVIFIAAGVTLYRLLIPYANKRYSEIEA